jgi:hypothetical protein
VEETVSASAVPALLRTESRPTSLSKLPEAMRSLWRAACPDTEDAGIARALVVNFVGIAPAADEALLRAATDRLLRRSPCRAFLLFVDDSLRDGDVVRAEVAATSRCSGALRDIVLEEVSIRLPCSWFPHVPGLLRPLLMNDLPNHLFWSGAWPADGAPLDLLASLCEHTVVDASRFEQPGIELAAVQDLRQQGRAITDLAWLRLRPWRRALAEALQDVPWSPGAAVAATIRHGRRATAAALLLGEWLRTRLAAEVAYEATADGDDPCPDAVDLRTRDHEVQAQRLGAHIAVHVATADRCRVPFSVPLSRGSDGDLLAAAIDGA